MYHYYDPVNDQIYEYSSTFEYLFDRWPIDFQMSILVVLVGLGIVFLYNKQ